MMPRKLYILVGLLLATATAAGALGTHALRPRLAPERYESFETAVTYQFFQALGLLGVALMLERREDASLRRAAYLLVLGIALFCGSVYTLALGGPRLFGAVAPLGGLSLMAGWALFAWAALRSGR